MNEELGFWQLLIRKAITDFLEGAIAVFGAVNVMAFASFVTVTAAGVQFDRAGAVDELALVAPAIALGLAHAAVAAVRRNGPAALDRIARYWANFLVWARG